MNEQTEIKKYFEDWLENKPSSTRKKCPPPGKLVKLLRLELPEKKRNEYIEHIAGCSSCAHEFRSIHEILKAENSFNHKMANMVSLQDHSQAGKSNCVKDFLWHPSWSLRTALLAVIVVILASPLFFVLKTKKPVTERDSIIQVSRLAPDKKTLDLDKLVFRWEAVPDSVYYTVEIFDDALRPIWQSERVQINRLVLSVELKGILQESQTYLWMVTSLLENGNRAESGLAKFTLKKLRSGNPRLK